jgi:DNA-binding NarL/FixJ family response regulator
METSNQQPRIYLVEDSPILLRLLRELLQSVGIAIVGHSDSAAIAIAEIGALRPDVIIVDIALQSGNGFDVLTAFAGRKESRHPICIVLTNYTSAPYQNAAKRLGVEYFFDKSTEILKMLKILTSMKASAGRQKNGSDA